MEPLDDFLAPEPEPPSKRRKLQKLDVTSSTSSPRIDPPLADNNRSRPRGRRASSPDPLQAPMHSLSLRRGESPSPSKTDRRSHSSSSTRSERSRTRSNSRSVTGSPARAPYHSRSRSYSKSRSQSRSRPRSRSRTRSGSRRRSHSRSRTRFRSPDNPQSRPRATSVSSPSSSPRPRLSPGAAGESAPSARPRQPLRPNFTQRLKIHGHQGPISQVRISPDGRWIASASADGTAKIWDAETGSHMETLVGHLAGISCLAWAPDSNTLATGSDDKGIRLWDRVTGSPAHACRDTDGSGAAGSIRRPRAGTARGGRSGRGPLLGHHNYVYSLAFSPKGNILASGSYDEAVFLWDVRAGRLMRSLPAHSDPVSGIDFCRDGTMVVSCSTDGLM